MPSSYLLASRPNIVVGLGFSVSYTWTIRIKNLNKMRSFFFEAVTPEKVPLCMHGWTSLAFPSRRKKPAVFAVVHEIGCISLTFTGATGGVGEGGSTDVHPKNHSPLQTRRGIVNCELFSSFFRHDFRQKHKASSTRHLAFPVSEVVV